MKLDNVCQCNTRGASQCQRGASWSQNNLKGKSQGQCQDRGAKHGRDKGMLEVQHNNQANFDMQCSRLEVKGSAKTRLEGYGKSVTAWQGSDNTKRGPWQCKTRAEGKI